ncbi:peptidoglycan recognition family protein [Lysobacter enzymogenes]|uniref:N-acetylmuramoyl-L-alanine amidase n=1 Tax=Lysobacter enzymogenes TaxID=69 RepID=A0A3N2RMV1_LYSEN|nr:peptidoglycan recognition family protein [Lysobacter enzymogenes]ROU08767.1 N-acetylmuramoyl-L-alanine amidase [Lysobacter enzymogenes]UKP15139.1 N-acetylmuramoyl-L-alanine amidase [Lysobacter enzymogenes]
MGTPSFPYDAAHPDHAQFQRTYDAVKAAGPWSDAQARNLAAGLYVELKRHPQMGGFDRVVAGSADAPVPSLFAVRGDPSSPAAQRVGVPLSLREVDAARTLAGYAHASQVDKDGYLEDPAIKRQPIAALEKGAIDAHHGIVMHRTESSTAKSALDAFKSGTGTHFLIDKDGTIYQTASLDQKTHHVGKIKGRCVEEGNCSAQEQAWFDKTGWNPKAVHDHEKAKAYPDRFPMNDDSVGIEVVGSYNAKTKTWDAPTAEQTASINTLVGALQKEYGLDDKDVYKHDAISYKTQGEGADLYVPAAANAPAVDGGVQSAAPRR